MLIAIDVDGVLSRDTVQLAMLMKAIKRDENKIVILTGSLSGHPTYDERLKQITDLGITADLYNELKIVDGQDQYAVALKKAVFCREEAVDMIFEDTDLYILKINEISPKTSTWLIRRF